MAFLKSVTPSEPKLLVHGDGVYMRAPAMTDYDEWAQLRDVSREFLVPWEPTWTRDELSRAAFRRRIRHYQKELRDGTGYAFFVFRDGDDALLGGLSLSNLRRGVTQSCSLGYWTGAPFSGQGVMTRSVQAAIPFVFDTLRLHRLEAACLPSNLASIRVLENNRFEREGLARRYLKINGIWQDHYLYGRLDQPLG